SPQDLAGLDVLPELVRAGVASLKIEGRLKSPEYVASITRVYRKALDQIAATTSTSAPARGPERGLKDRPPTTLAAPPAARSGSTPAAPSLSSRSGPHGPALDSHDPARAKYELSMTFSRGLYTGWFNGIQNQELAHGRFGTKRGVFLGKVTRVADD